MRLAINVYLRMLGIKYFTQNTDNLIYGVYNVCSSDSVAKQYHEANVDV